MIETEKLALEQLVDRHGLAGVVDALSDIAREKAEHIRVNWQDSVLADTWEDLAERLSSYTTALEHRSFITRK